jgi:hypothetical protein
VDIDLFIVVMMKRMIERSSQFDMEKVILEEYKEYAEDTCDMVWKETYGGYTDEMMLEFLTNEMC